MEREYNCVKCTKAFKVFNEQPRPVFHEAELTVECPFCRTSNVITWPSNTKYAVAPITR
jgi:hypothetical protein